MNKPCRLLLLAAATAGLAACATCPDGAGRVPSTAQPLPQPPVDRVVNGSLFLGDDQGLFAGGRLPRAIGDTLKVDIAEALEASNLQKSDLSRDNKVATKGPGTGAGVGALNSLLNLDASAAGSDSFKGTGSTSSSTRFNGRLAVTVVNVLSNGNLVVAGERSLRLSSGATILRFSGVVSPADIRSGNVVASADVVDARLETLGTGEVGDSARRGWLQRLLTNTLRVW